MARKVQSEEDHTCEVFYCFGFFSFFFFFSIFSFNKCKKKRKLCVGCFFILVKRASVIASLYVI